MSKAQKEKEFAHLLEHLKKDAFYVAPPGGESIATWYSLKITSDSHSL